MIKKKLSAKELKELQKYSETFYHPEETTGRKEKISLEDYDEQT